MRKKVFIHAYTKLNVGDDLFLYLVAKRFPNYDFIVCSTFDYNETFLKDLNNLIFTSKENPSFLARVGNYFSGVMKIAFLKSYFLQQIIKQEYRNIIKSVDIILVIGGSMFIQSKDKQETYDMAIYTYFSKFREKEKYIIGSNFGPFKGSEYFRYFENVFKKFDQINFREKKSYNLFDNFDNVKFYPDLVFSLDINEFGVKLDSKRRSVGFSLVEITKFEESINLSDYLNNISNMVLYFVSLKYDIKFYSFADFEGDRDLIAQLKMKIAEFVDLEFEVINYNGQKSFIQDFCSNEITICSRFHAMILGIISKCKVYTIPYGKKMSNVIEDYDLNIFQFDMKEKYSIENYCEIFKDQNNKDPYIQNTIEESQKNFLVLNGKS